MLLVVDWGENDALLVGGMSCERPCTRRDFWYPAPIFSREYIARVGASGMKKTDVKEAVHDYPLEAPTCLNEDRGQACALKLNFAKRT
jgi:hypothetical protein